MGPHDVSWDDLKIFLAVGRHQTLSAAARDLKVDDSTVSRRIAQLESSFGETLMVRGRAGVTLTPRGEELLQHLHDMERSALAATSSCSPRDRGNPRGRVRVATMEGIATLYLARQFIEMRERYPLLEVELVTSGQAVNVSRREADVFLSFFRPEGRGLHVEAVGQFALHLYGSPQYLARHGTPATPDDLGRHTFVSYIEDVIQLDTVRWLKELVPNPHVVFHSSSMLAQLSAAAAGGGLTMQPSFAKAEQLGLVRVLPGCAVRRELWLSVHQDLEYTPRIRAVLEYMRMILRRDYQSC